MEKIKTDILVVGGGVGGTAAAIQAARCGVKTILVSEEYWLGGMLTSAGVSAPDGNELACWQTGLWGAYLRALQRRQKGQLNHSWVSLFSYHPRTGANILRDWVNQLDNLQWIAGQKPLELIRENNRILGVRFQDYIIFAKIVIDGTELGDLLALGEVSHRWGWDFGENWQEPSAPHAPTQLTHKYPVQSPTWVVILQDYGQGQKAPKITPPSSYNPTNYEGAWDGYGGEMFLNYGRLPHNLFMINWPHHGNDYGENLNRLISSQEERQSFLTEAFNHSLGFAYFIQQELGIRYGLAKNTFPSELGWGAFALHPYFRESRRLIGKKTIIEQDILPVAGGNVAQLPLNEQGQISAIAVGNYANDHHYPNFQFPLQPKSIRWGGRWTGTPFCIPYESLIPENTEGFLVCEKNISVSHLANGSTRLQPLVMNIGQAAGMAAALSIQLNCEPNELNVRIIQEKLLTDQNAPAIIVPFFDLLWEHSQWVEGQRFYLDRPEEYPISGYFYGSKGDKHSQKNAITQKNDQIFDKKLNYLKEKKPNFYEGIIHHQENQEYYLEVTYPENKHKQSIQLITILPQIHIQLKQSLNLQKVSLWGNFNASGNWLLVEKFKQICPDLGE